MEIDISKLTLEEQNLVNEKLKSLLKFVDEKSMSKLKQVLNLISKFNLGFDVYSSAIVLFEIENGLALLDDYKFKNKEIKYIVETVYSLEQFNFKSYNDEAENIHKVFLSLVKNLTVVILVLIKMLVKMRYLDDLPKENQKFLCEYAREIYAPLAARLGFSDIKGEMEDICLKFFEPKAYSDLENLIKTYWHKTSLMLKELRIILANMLVDLNIKGEIFARQKHISSVYKKMATKNVTIAEIYDFAALRVVVETEEECYSVLGKIHSKFKPMAGRIKDYIASPKPNGYQSLHTTIIYSNENPVEIQIRTKKMHLENEIGISAHFLYKEHKQKKNVLDERLVWVRTLMEKSKNSSHIEFVETLKMDLFPGKILVQTPKGKVVELPEGACVIDFAYAIHSALGNCCLGAKVNGKFVPISTTLNNNDNVEVITSPTVKGPSIDWLKIVKTSEARNKINAYFKSKLKAENIKKGRNLLEKYISTKGYNLKDVTEKLDSDFLYKKFSVKDCDGLFATVGYGSIKVEIAGNRLIANYEIDHPKTEPKLIKEKNSSGKGTVVIENEKSFLVKFASCCSPVVGDNIVAYTTRGRGMSIHRADCSNLKYLEKERILPAVWSGDSSSGEITVKISTMDNCNALSKITNALNNLKVEMISLSAKSVSGKTEMVVKLIINNSNDFDKIKKRLFMFDFVLDVKRI